MKALINSKGEYVNYVNGKFYPNNTPFIYPKETTLKAIEMYATNHKYPIDFTGIELIDVEVIRKPKIDE